MLHTKAEHQCVCSGPDRKDDKNNGLPVLRSKKTYQALHIIWQWWCLQCHRCCTTCSQIRVWEESSSTLTIRRRILGTFPPLSLLSPRTDTGRTLTCWIKRKKPCSTIYNVLFARKWFKGCCQNPTQLNSTQL